MWFGALICYASGFASVGDFGWVFAVARFPQW